MMEYILRDNGIFPNSKLPALLYKAVLQLPFVLAASSAEGLFKKNGWGNNWTGGIYTYHHYHSITHEALAIVKGKTSLQLGGDDGVTITIEKGDVIIIPAGIAHKNTGNEYDVTCVAGYPGGQTFDVNNGRPGERPITDKNIAEVPLPDTDPVFGAKGELLSTWQVYNR